MDLIKPKEITLKDIDGESITFTISRLPATVAREIITQYPLTAVPKIGDYGSNHDLMVKLMSYIEVVKDSGNLRLSNKSLIDNHVPDGETLMKLEGAMLDYNTNFLSVAKISKKLTGFSATMPQLITQILTRSLASLSESGKQPSKSSGKSTTSKTR